MSDTKDTVAIPRDLADELLTETYSLMFHYSYCDNDSDFVCEFCGKRAETNDANTINHKTDCLGPRLLEALRGE